MSSSTIHEPTSETQFSASQSATVASDHEADPKCSAEIYLCSLDMFSRHHEIHDGVSISTGRSSDQVDMGSSPTNSFAEFAKPQPETLLQQMQDTIHDLRGIIEEQTEHITKLERILCTICRIIPSDFKFHGEMIPQARPQTTTASSSNARDIFEDQRVGVATSETSADESFHMSDPGHVFDYRGIGAWRNF